MTHTNLKALHNFYSNKKQLFIYLLKWTLLSLIMGALIGAASALFLYLLHFVTDYRTNHIHIIYLLPLAGLLSGLIYHYYGGKANLGNNLLIDEYHEPKKVMPLKMAPFVLFGTLLTHLFGGSAGREGTAIQMGGAIADQFSRFVNLLSTDRKTIILMGVSGGFASVFGTPLAGTLFALELMLVGSVLYQSIFPTLMTALVAHYVCILLGTTHTTYIQDSIAIFDLITIIKVITAGIMFGLAAILFIKATDIWASFLKKSITYPPLRLFIGGIVFLFGIFLIGDYKYLGLGVPVIEDAFINHQESTVFILKIVFTAITLGAGFKGGEVTPLFFIGATLGSFLAVYLNVPVDFLAAVGFVAVFAGATKTPWACTLMAIELFGSENGVYFAIACTIAFLISGKHTIYKSQKFT